MSDGTGRDFLDLIDRQNEIQWKIVARLSSLIESDWESGEIRADLKALVREHIGLTQKISDMDRQHS